MPNTKRSAPFSVVDLFSGAGGMSCGFHSHPDFRLIGAVDLEQGKPSSGSGALECNSSYEANIGIVPLAADMKVLSPAVLKAHLKSTTGKDEVDVLISCAPCTGFSRVIRQNLVEDDVRNSLVVRSADFAISLRPRLFFMENVGELLEGKFTHHFDTLRQKLERAGYSVYGDVHSLTRFGVPQMRRRALIVAARRPLPVYTLEDLWEGFEVCESAVTVRRAIGDLPAIRAGVAHPDDPAHVSPSMTPTTLRRLELISRDGGSWPDLLRHPEGEGLLIPSMRRYSDVGKVGPHPDVYGRLAWDRPAVTIKRECAHTGNGRYAHPEQNRLCTVRELAILQGFPRTYKFAGGSMSNMYRHVGDAVPPIVSYQIAHAASWMLTGSRPRLVDAILPGTHLRATDIVNAPRRQTQLNLAGMA